MTAYELATAKRRDTRITEIEKTLTPKLLRDFWRALPEDDIYLVNESDEAFEKMLAGILKFIGA